MAAILAQTQSITYDFTPLACRLSPSIWTVFTALNHVHRIWRCYRYANFYAQASYSVGVNFSQLLAGHIINKVMGSSLLVRVAAQALCITTRLLECTQQQSVVVQTAGQLFDAIHGKYAKPIKIAWESCCSSLFFSAETIYSWKTNAYSFYYRIERIALLTLNLMQELFKLSMLIMDVVDVFYWTPEMQNQAVCEGFINISYCFNAIITEKDELLAQLRSHQTIVERLLTGTPFSYSQLESAVTQTLNTTEKLHDGMQSLAEMGDGILIDMCKRAINGMSMTLGFGVVFPRQ